MLNSSESSTVADLILEKAMEVGPFDLGIVHLLRDRQLEPNAHRGLLDPAIAQAYPLGTADRRLAMQNILARQEPLVVEDVPGYNGLAVYKREAVITAVAVPLRAGSETLGVLAVGARSARQITPALRQLLSTMGSHLGVAIQKTRLYEETQQALADLERTEEGHKRLAAILEASPEFVGIADRDGHWLFINAAGRRLLGIGLTADVASLTMEQLTAPGGCALLREAALPAAVRDGTWIGETALAGADGREIPVSQLILAHHDSSGRVEFFSTIARDLTERRSIEQQLARAQRLETAGQVAGQVAHDFNNLLAPLVGYPELIKMRLPPGHPIVELCDRMLDAATRMAQINDDLLTLGRRGHFEHHALDLNALVRDAVAQMPEMPPSVVLDLDLGDELLPILGSGAQISRLLINLILNARDAMADVGRLTIRTRLHFVAASTGRAGDVEAGEYVCVEIEDTGSGIPAEIRDRIFDVFFTTKHADQHRGTGMGLSIVQAVADDHHAHVSLESAVGIGTTFRVLFPVYRGATGGARPSERVGAAASALIVDDDLGQRDVLAQLLGTLGFRVETVPSGEEAVARLAEQPFDLITLDMVMPPGIDGVETYRRIRSIYPHQRTLIISAFAESDRVSEAQALGAGEYVRKPVTLDSLARAVRTEFAGGS
jgi:PAS domain S-box-containing protein